MNGIVLGRCTDCDSEYFFMDGSRCAACLSALQAGAPEAIETEPADNVYLEDADRKSRLLRAS